jgi:hypothetical protein
VVWRWHREERRRAWVVGVSPCDRCAKGPKVRAGAKSAKATAAAWGERAQKSTGTAKESVAARNRTVSTTSWMWLIIAGCRRCTHTHARTRTQGIRSSAAHLLFDRGCERVILLPLDHVHEVLNRIAVLLDRLLVLLVVVQRQGLLWPATARSTRPNKRFVIRPL